MSFDTFTVTDACTACGACLLTCPERCLRPTASGPVPLVVIDEACTGCGECAEVCPAGACVPVGGWRQDATRGRHG